MKRLALHGALLLALVTCGQPLQALESVEAKVVQTPKLYRFDGIIEAVNQSTIAAQTRGEILEILVDVDDKVEKDRLIIRLRDTEQRANQEQAQAELRSAQATLTSARQEHSRVLGVFRKQLVAQAAMDNATANLNSAQARLAAVQAALKQADEQLAYTQIRAPYSGIVTQRHIETGEIASPGQPLISGISLDQLRVSVAIPQSLIEPIRNASQTTVELPDNQQITPRKITVFPFANPQTGTFELRLSLPENPGRLFPGMHTKVRFQLGNHSELLIPQSAVVYRSEVTGAYILAGEKLQFRHIRTGQRRPGGMIAVLAGMDAGEQVALDPIAAGARLKQQRTAKPNE